MQGREKGTKTPRDFGAAKKNVLPALVEGGLSVQFGRQRDDFFYPSTRYETYITPKMTMPIPQSTRHYSSHSTIPKPSKRFTLKMWVLFLQEGKKYVDMLLRALACQCLPCFGGSFTAPSLELGNAP